MLRLLGALSDERFSFAPIITGIVLPPPCQGIIALQCRTGEASPLPAALGSESIYACFEAERQIAAIGGADSLAAFSEIKNGKLHITVTADQHKIISGTADPAAGAMLAGRLANAAL